MGSRGTVAGLLAALAASAPVAAAAGDPAGDRAGDWAGDRARPIVAELFTSEGCSSCPPADALLRELALTRDDVLPLAFHVTYWNNLGWRDPYSLDAATARQRDYAGVLPSDVYTPQLVVEGRIDVIGSDRGAVETALRSAAGPRGDGVEIALRREGADGVIDVSGVAPRGEIARAVLIGYDAEHATPVGRGENAGRKLVEANIVRAIVPVGDWRGGVARWRVAMPAGERHAVLLQSAAGAILGAARENNHAD